MSLNKESLNKAANEARGLAMDAIAKCKSGHLGLPLGAAEVGACLFGSLLNYHPGKPDWINRDRFVLSAGHGSMFIYAWLHIAGYDVSLEDVKSFRKLNSKTPGHPEFGHTPGVESTTGPLGQGVGNSVGMAMSAKMAAAKFNTAAHSIFNHKIVCLAGDGCLQEGVAQEASAMAGHLKLDNLIIIYDDNDITLDAPAESTQSEDTAKRYEAYGFDVQKIDGHDLDAIAAAYDKAAGNNGKPQLIMAKTIAGKGIPEVEGVFKAHGEAGVKFVDEARKGLGLPEESFHVSDDTRNFFESRKAALQEAHDAWQKTFDDWKSKEPKKAKELDAAVKGSVPADLLSSVPTFDCDAIATRGAGEKVLNALADKMPLLISGSADLHGSTKNYIKDAGDFSSENHSGRNILFGIREHAMGAIMNGYAYHGLFRVSGATFLTFSDYMRPSVRLAALSNLPVFYIWTHDSVGVGEDGPTHQPVEVVSSLRLIPNLDVIRPGDPEETAAAFVSATQRSDGPTALILSRQNVPNLSSVNADTRREGTLKGGYIIKKESGKLNTIIMATGSELGLAMEAAEKLGDSVRVVSMPCIEIFDRQTADYRDSVLPPECSKRIAIEAGATAIWHRLTGSNGTVIGIDRFGLSAPGDTVMKELGISTDNLVNRAQSL